jgi:hypothetical protein
MSVWAGSDRSCQCLLFGFWFGQGSASRTEWAILISSGPHGQNYTSYHFYQYHRILRIQNSLFAMPTVISATMTLSNLPCRDVYPLSDCILRLPYLRLSPAKAAASHMAGRHMSGRSLTQESLTSSFIICCPPSYHIARRPHHFSSQRWAQS